MSAFSVYQHYFFDATQEYDVAVLLQQSLQRQQLYSDCEAIPAALYGLMLQPKNALEPQAVYLGKIVSLKPEWQAMMVDIGTEKPVFVRTSQHTPLLAAGSLVIITIRRPPMDGKEAMAEMSITITHPFFILQQSPLPHSKRISFSKRWPNNQLKPEIAPEIWMNRQDISLILRHHAATIDKERIKQEISLSYAKIEQLQAAASQKQTVGLLCEAPALYQRLLESYGLQNVEYKGKEYWPAWLEEAIATLHSTRFSLKTGEVIHIESTKAGWMVDVDSGSQKNTAMANHHAIDCIGRLISLKNMGGRILIDPAGNETPQRLLAELQKKLALDPWKNELYGYTRSGLIEIVREKNGQSLHKKQC
ncbi:MAG: ribonuclease E/G [Alphaproteobacteria bacterium]